MKSNNRIYWVAFTLLGLAVGYFLASQDTQYLFAQNPANPDANIIVASFKAGDDSSILALIDTRLEKIVLYEISNRRTPPNRLKLIAVRNYSYDKLLDQYNNADPTPEAIKEMLLSPETNKSTFKKSDLKDLVDQTN